MNFMNDTMKAVQQKQQEDIEYKNELLSTLKSIDQKLDIIINQNKQD